MYTKYFIWAVIVHVPFIRITIKKKLAKKIYKEYLDNGSLLKVIIIWMIKLLFENDDQIV